MVEDKLGVSSLNCMGEDVGVTWGIPEDISEGLCDLLEVCQLIWL